MDNYSSTIDFIPHHIQSGCIFHPETLLRYHLTKMRIFPVLAPITATILRDEAAAQPTAPAATA
jgi:hypothetical protein